ncbi:MAG: protoporphyrinogen oxidase [Halobacteria archaeon]|nr:protoporphyrinogen oxidase [Halobacteria archaeon]
MAKVGVVGGGISGLSLSYYLDKKGISYEVFESEPEPGGVIKTREIEDRVVDLGPQRTALTPEIKSIIEDLDLSTQVVKADRDKPVYIYHHGRLRQVPFSPFGFLRTDLLSWRGKLRVFLEPFTRSPREDETVGEFFTRKFGAEACDYFLGPLYGGTYGSNPDDMPMRHSLFPILENAGLSDKRSLLFTALKRSIGGSSLPPTFSFQEGMQTLPKSLYERHEENIHLESPVNRIKKTNGGFDVVTKDRTLGVDEVVLTTPSDVTADLIRDIDPEGSERLEGLNYNPIAVVHLESDSDLEGFGYQVQWSEDYKTLGVTWNASIFNRDKLHTCFLGGAKNPDLINEPDELIGETAREEFEDINECEARVLNVHTWEHGFPAYDGSWGALDSFETPNGIHICANYVSRAGTPGRVRQARGVAEEIASVLGNSE